MANQDWKSITITFVVAALILHYFIAAPVQNKSFEISKNHIKYHANWTSHFSQLEHVNQLQEAYKLDSIESIDIAFSMSNLDLESIKKVFPTQFKQYKKIKINLANNPIGTVGADYILSLIPNQVEQLEVAFDSIDADIQLGSTIVKRLNNLNSLKKLKLSLILAVKNDSVIEDYLRFGRIGERLQSYSLIFIGNGLTSKSVEYLETHLSRANLKHLELNFYANKLGAEGAKIVSQAIKSQKNLSSLAVDFYFNNITTVGTEAISSAIGEINQPNLKTLLLNLDFNYIQNDGGKALGNLLPLLKNIESLHLGVASKNFGYLGFKHIVNGLSQLTQLKQLNFRCGVNRVGGGGSDITKDLLLKLKNLVVLNLNFYENYIGDDGVENIVEGVVSLQHLEKLSLNLGFSDAKGLGIVHGLEVLAKKTFKQLYLGFSSNEIKDSEVNLIIDELKEIIKKTKVFEFQFMETAISKKQQNKLEKLFESGKLSGNKAVIHVNSVISDQQQKKYQQAAEKQQKLKEAGNQVKNNFEKKKQQKVEKQRVVEQEADEVIELDNKQTQAIVSVTEQKVSEQVVNNIQLEANTKEQSVEVKAEQPVQAVVEAVEPEAKEPVEEFEEPVQAEAQEPVEQVEEPVEAEIEQFVQPQVEQQIEAETVQAAKAEHEESVEAEAAAQIVEAQVQQPVEAETEQPIEQTDESVKDQAEQPIKVEAEVEEPAAAEAEQIVEAETAAKAEVEEPVESEAEQIVESKVEQTIEPEAEQTLSAIQEPIKTQEEQPIIQAKIEQPAALIAVQPVEAKVAQIVEVQAENQVESETISNKQVTESSKQPQAIETVGKVVHESNEL